MRLRWIEHRNRIRTFVINPNCSEFLLLLLSTLFMLHPNEVGCIIWHLGCAEGEPSGVCGMDFFLQQNLLVFHTIECSIHYTPLSPRHSNECTQKKEKTPRAKVIKIRLHRRGQNIQIDRMIEDVSARSYFSTNIKYHCEEKEKWLSQIQAN